MARKKSKKWLWVALIAIPVLMAGAVVLKNLLIPPSSGPKVVKLVINPVRTLDDLAERMASVLDASKDSIMAVMNDSAFVDSLGYDQQTLIAMFIPNTYEVWQNVSPRRLLLRLKKEHDDFWTDERLMQAENQALSEEEVMTLASIVEQETACDAERPMIAGMYLNRLSKEMLLQADPTVKHAVGDPALRRILGKHTKVDSPYNTYLYPGLPPGPICVPSMASIKAVLEPAEHDYLYMCAKEDLSGTHNFAKTYKEHMVNARNYAKALNERGIK